MCDDRFTSSGLAANFTPTSAALTGLFVHSAVRTTGDVTFAHPVLDGVQKAIVQTQKSNLHFHPTDCPQREKRGWTGDAQFTSRQASLNLDMRQLYGNWLQTMADHDDAGCAIAGIAPVFPQTNKDICCNPKYIHTLSLAWLDFARVSAACSWGRGRAVAFSLFLISPPFPPSFFFLGGGGGGAYSISILTGIPSINDCRGRFSAGRHSSFGCDYTGIPNGTFKDTGGSVADVVPDRAQAGPTSQTADDDELGFQRHMVPAHFRFAKGKPPLNWNLMTPEAASCKRAALTGLAVRVLSRAVPGDVPSM